MSIVNFGSINLDFVYRVERLVRPGETVQAMGQQLFSGGKGFNQSVALARAGASVRHVGRVGEDGRWLVDALEAEGIQTDAVEYGKMPTGHAIIQVDSDGENNILVCGGANLEISAQAIEQACAALETSDWVLLQNETNATAQVMRIVGEMGNPIVLNPSPMEPSLLELPLASVDTFIINRTEGETLSGEREPKRILERLAQQYPRASVVLTLGHRGVLFARESLRLEVPAEPVKAVDTTGAGDTFAGYFLAEMSAGSEPLPALQLACRAAAHCVTQPGASPSIPHRSQLDSGHA